MNKRFSYTALCVALAVGLAGCATDNSKKEKNVADKEQWVLSLEDSLKATENSIVEATAAISSMRAEIDSMLPLFERVDDSRLVEGYVVYKGWRGYNTGAGNGILARMLDNESLEIVASSAVSDFESISVISGTESCLSDKVPYDNALNYRSGNVNIVAFGGEHVDSIGEFVAKNINNPVKLEYWGRSGLKHRILLSDKQKEMIAATWKLVRTHRELNRTERMLPLYNEKIRILKSRLD